MRMKRVFAAGALLLALTPNFAAAQEYYTLPEIREQAKGGWHETYTDKYGRETVVDIDVEVYGGEKAPVLKTKPAWYAVQPEKLDAGAEWTERAWANRHLASKSGGFCVRAEGAARSR